MAVQANVTLTPMNLQLHPGGAPEPRAVHSEQLCPLIMCPNDFPRKGKKRRGGQGRDGRDRETSTCLASFPKHRVWRFGELLTTDDFQNELLFGVGRKWIPRERIEGTYMGKTAKLKCKAGVLRAHKHAHAYTCSHTCMNIHRILCHACVDTCTHTQSHMHTYILNHTCMYTLVSHTHTDIHYT